MYKWLLILALAVWFWEDDRGVYHFVDSIEKIPEMYRLEALPLDVEGLEEYHRYTPSDQ